MKRAIQKYVCLFFVGGAIYLLLEMITRDGHTHWVMGIVGGICFVFIGLINEINSRETSFWLQCLMGGLIVTIVELVSGIVINRVLRWNVWDYSDHMFQCLGQTCLEFSLLWCLVSAFAILLDDYIRFWFFGQEKPRYRF